MKTALYLVLIAIIIILSTLKWRARNVIPTYIPSPSPSAMASPTPEPTLEPVLESSVSASLAPLRLASPSAAITQ